MLHSAFFLPVSVLLNPGVNSCLPVTLLHLVRAPGRWPCSPHLKMGGGSGEGAHCKAGKDLAKKRRIDVYPIPFYRVDAIKRTDMRKLQRFLDHEQLEADSMLYQKA